MIYCADKTTQFLVEGFCDFDYTTDLDKKRLLIGYIFTFARNIMNQKNCLQHIVALPTTGTKYITLTEAIKKVLWLKWITDELDLVVSIPVIFYDSQSAILL